MRLLCLSVALLALSPRAHAQTMSLSTTAFSVERFVPPPGATPFWAVDDADVLPHLAFSFGGSLSLMKRPLLLRDLFTRELVLVPVDVRTGMELSAAVGLGSRYQVGLGLPMVVYQSGDRVQGIGLGESPLAAAALGDLRLSGKARLIGKPGSAGRAVAVGLGLTMPTGNQEHFAGEEGWIIEMHMLGSWRNRWLAAGADLGVRIRTSEVIFISPGPHGNELNAAVGAAAVVPGLSSRSLVAALEYAHVLGDASSSGVRGPSPGEARGGLRWSFVNGWSLGLMAGLGTTPDEVGSPRWRVAATLRFDLLPLTDIDDDGIPDGRDRCRSQPEDRDGFEDDDGCPDRDNDKDGYPDDADDCPDAAEDYDGHRDVDGCPDEERDVPPTPPTPEIVPQPEVEPEVEPTAPPATPTPAGPPAAAPPAARPDPSAPDDTAKPGVGPGGDPAPKPAAEPADNPPAGPDAAAPTAPPAESP